MGFEVTDAPRLYAEATQRVAEALSLLTDAQAQAAVPACPGWTVKDVMAHVSGLVAETLAGVPLPRGSDAATARQVGNRAEMSLGEVVAEWQSNAEAFAGFGCEDPAYVAALTADLVVHAADIAEALDQRIELSAEVVSKVAWRYGEALQQRCADTADTALTIAFTDAPPLAHAESGSRQTLELTVAAAEFIRCVTGRRSRPQVEQLSWSADPAHVLDAAWSQYGPLRG